MKCGICICGLNGSGKTALSSALAKELNFKHMDIENYYFSPTDTTYSSQKSREEVENLLLDDMQHNSCFVFSAVNGNISKEVNKFYDVVIYLDVPLDIRMARIRQRALDKFGNRILPSGDMYEQEEKFFESAAKKSPEKIKSWLKTINCKIFHLDGTKPIDENILIIKNILLQEKAEF